MILAVGASAFTTPDRLFKDGDAPKCFMIGGETIVQYDRKFHKSFKCTHNAAKTACTPTEAGSRLNYRGRLSSGACSRGLADTHAEEGAPRGRLAAFLLHQPH